MQKLDIKVLPNCTASMNYESMTTSVEYKRLRTTATFGAQSL